VVLGIALAEESFGFTGPLGPNFCCKQLGCWGML
jgi:hypothetical protein